MHVSSDPYYDWLCMTIDNRGYEELTWKLHHEEFQAKLPADKNRGMDGMQLRVDFMQEHKRYGSATNRSGCTMLELLIALAKRMNFLMYGNHEQHHTAYYFWKLIENLGLKKVSDDQWHVINGDFFVEDAVFRVVDRQYDANGRGGLFPLRHPKEDQRGVEIWYQMHAWLGENSDIDLDF